MISSFISTGKLSGRAFACAPSLGFSPSILNGTGTSGVLEVPSVSLSGLNLSLRTERERGVDGRPTKALAAGVVARAQAQAQAYASAAASAVRQTKQMTHDHEMWAFRGPDPWSPPA
jgi:hypothetical protein